ncbi:hypothetical protein KAF25_006927 [Fusarium avenaceum]|uniref:Amidohydrolase-related domain-containing protein n=1 Tax=Fusarium avenaceum TaxID=40199 RepID=A0A9P7KT17_9HYPO|nr:hypothetical protein KAF25_006927 [Fusarium avenaceum]
MLGRFSFFLFSTCVLATSKLFEHGTIISFDEDTQTPIILRNASLLITDDRIVAISGPSNGNLTVPPGTEHIDATGDIISPGFVDTHRHAWQTVERTLGASSSLAEYLSGWSSQSAGIFDEEIMYHSELQGLCEALDAGVTTIVDNASGVFSEEIADAAIRAAVDSGIRNFFAYSISRGQQDFGFEDQIQHFRKIINSERLSATRVSMGLAYESFDTGSEEDIETIITLARQSNIKVLQTHFVGGSMGTNNSPSRLLQLGILNSTYPIIFVHASGVTPIDEMYLRDTNQYISVAPEFEMHHGNDQASSSLVQDQGSLSVGSHYSFSGDLVTQARIWLQSVRYHIYTRHLAGFKIPTNNPMSANQAFLLGTRSGGQALRRPDLGVIRVGSKADIAVFDGSARGLLGWQDPVAAIILHSQASHVKHVLVDGHWMKKDGQLRCASNRADFQFKFLESARRVQRFFERAPMPVFEGRSLVTGALYESVPRVDALRGPGTGY